MTTFENFFDEETKKDKKGLSKLFGMGFSGNQISKIEEEVPQVLSISEDKLRDRLTYLSLRGFKHKEEIFEITSKEPSILTSSVEELYQKCVLLTKLGYSEREVNKLISGAPVVLTLTIDEIVTKLKEVMTLGFTKSEVAIISKRYPAVFSSSLDELKAKINEIEKVGYSKEQVINMIKIMPELFGTKLVYIENALSVLQRLNYSKADLIEITSKYPELYSKPLSYVKNKLEFYKTLRLRSVVVDNPSIILKDDEVVYARYSLMKKMGIKVDKDNLAMLYVENAVFKKHFGYSKAELLKMFPYKEEKVKTKTK